MVHLMTWLLIIQIAIINNGVCSSFLHNYTTEIEEIHTADRFFDYSLCNDEDALQWACFVPGDCRNEDLPNVLREWPQGKRGIENCHAVLAIQQQSRNFHFDDITDKKVWRVVLQMQKINGKMNIGHGIYLYHDNEVFFTCFPGEDKINARQNGLMKNVKGLQDSTKFMCDFEYTFYWGQYFNSDAPMGIIWSEVNRYKFVKAEIESSVVLSVLTAKTHCKFEYLKFVNPYQSSGNENILVEEIITDRRKIVCPTGYTMFAKQNYKSEEPYESYEYIECITDGVWRFYFLEDGTAHPSKHNDIFRDVLSTYSVHCEKKIS